MKRLFFLIPDLKVAHAVSEELVSLGVKDSCIHVMGGDVEVLKKAHLHPGTLFHTNVLPALKWGVVVGIITMVIIFGLFTLFLPKDVTWHPIGLLAVVVFGMGFGFWSTGMLSLVKNPVIEKNESYLKQGHYLMLVDVPAKEADNISQKITAHHAGTKIAEKKI